MTTIIRHRHTGEALLTIEGNSPGADLSEADLYGANLHEADLSKADVPIIPNIHAVLYEAVTTSGNSLDMAMWHTCDTTHCRAGWITTLAGDSGKALESKVGTNAAAAMIYQVSDPTLRRIPNWYASYDEAMVDIKRLALA